MAKGSTKLSKAGLRFVNRVDYFDEDIEFSELLYKSREKVLPSLSSGPLFNGMSTAEPMLSRKQVCTQSRTLVIAHLRSTVYTAFFKEIYEEFTEYLGSLLEEAAKLSRTKGEAHKVIGDTKISIPAADLLQCQDIQDIHVRIAHDILRQLENERSTIKLIEKVCDRIGINVEKKIIEEALPYLELRHLLVHADGKADKQFKEKYGSFFSYRQNNVILNKQLAERAKSNISSLVKAIDSEAVNKGIMKENNAG